MSAYTTRLKLEKQVSGENSGNWGNLVNYVFNRIDSTVRGYVAVDVAGSANVTLVSNTSTTNTSEGADDQVHNKVIEFTGALTGSIHVFTDAVEGEYILYNNTSGSYDLTFANTGHAANGVAISQGSRAIVYSDGSTIYDAGFVTLPGTQTLTNKTLTAPKIGTSILDTGGNELFLLTATGSAVNELTYNNASTGNNPTFTASGDDTNIGLNLVPKGTGVLQGAGSALKIAGKETIWVPASAMYPSVTAGAPDAETIEITADANRPVIKAIAFDKDTDEYAQFSIAFPKSWNEGTITFQPFFTANSTNTGTALFMLKGITVSDNDPISVDFGTAQGTAKAHSGTAYDLDVGAESSAITIAGSPAVGDQTFFAIFRDVSGDTLTADALLTGIKIFFTTDAANDA
jgi:hypothetical protein